MKTVAGSLRLDLSQYRELEAFAAFASDLDPTSRAQLDRGARLVELLKQAQYTPYPVEEQVVSIYAGTKGHLDSVPVPDISRFESELLDYVRHHTPDVLTDIRETGKLSEETDKRLADTVLEFKKGFSTSSGAPVVEEEVEPMDASEEGKDSVKVSRPAPQTKK
jgi:F-type H+-transporting ATPase subunit alpha